MAICSTNNFKIKVANITIGYKYRFCSRGHIVAQTSVPLEERAQVTFRYNSWC